MTISGWAEQYFMDPERFYPVKVWVKLLAALMFVFLKWISVVRILRYVLMIHFRSVWKDLAFILLFGILVKGSLLLCSSCNYVASWILKEDLMTIHEHNYPNIYTILYKIYTVYIYIHSKCVFIWYQQLGLLPMSGFGWCLATCHEGRAFQPSSRGTRDRFTHVHIMYSLIIALQFVTLCFLHSTTYRCVCQYWYWKYIRHIWSDTLNSYVFLDIRYIHLHTSSVQFALYIVIYSFLHIGDIQNIMCTFDCEKDNRIGR